MERDIKYNHTCASPPYNEFLGGGFNASTTSRIADGVSSFRQINGCRNFAACVLCMHPEYRILILSAESTLASRMVVHIRNILENHPRCADMIPTGRRTWACDRIIINRPVGIREPSVICAGIAGNITGSRADLIICDDVEVPNTCNTAQKREKLRERLRELEFILSPTGTMIYIGTPHTTDTIYRTSDGG